MYVINSYRKKEPYNELTINTELAGSASNAFVLPLHTIDHVTVDWGDEAVEDFSTSGNKTHVYNTPGIYTVKMYGTGAQMFSFNNAGDRRKVISGAIGNTGWTTFDSAFRDCSSLTALDVSTWDVSSVVSFQQAFRDCSSLTALDVSTWDVGAVTNFSSVFNGCSSLTSLDVSTWDVSFVSSFNSAFFGCSSLTALDVSTWDVSSVVSFLNVFNGCSSLTSLDASAWVMSANLASVSYNGTFRNCGTLNLKIGTGWNFSALTQGYNASAFLQGTNIGSTNYNNMLSIIASQTLSNNVTFGGGNSKYTATGKVHRDAIIASNNWTFSDGGLA